VATLAGLLLVQLSYAGRPSFSAAFVVRDLYHEIEWCIGVDKQVVTQSNGVFSQLII
jgi:hypothetical protein